MSGNALAPRYRNGDTLAIDPDRKPQPGDAVLAFFDGNLDKRGVMFLNADLDLTDNGGAWVASGHFEIQGVVIGSAPARPL